MKDLKGKNIVVVGAGRSGIAAADLCVQQGARVVILERRLDVESSVVDYLRNKHIALKVGEHTPGDFKGADLVVLSPGVPSRKIKLLLDREIDIISEVELGSWFLEEEKVVGVTGSNGKTTTVGIIHHVFTIEGISHFVGGNYGDPLCEYILSGEKKEVVLLELSSFQLQNIISFRPHIALLLNISPNHLDYHRDMQEYIRSKLNIFKNQTKDDLAIINRDLSQLIEKEPLLARTVFFHGELDFPSSLKGRHNRENLNAAYLVCKEMGISPESFARAVTSFSPFPHRLEYVGEKNGISFYNDSKSTTLKSLEAALTSFDKRIFLIVGGILKGGDPAFLIPLLRERVEEVCVYGESASLFLEAWKGVVPVFRSKDIKEAVEYLFSRAKEKDIVLLSPGCSSFDMFSSYKERGEEFKRVVCSLGGVKKDAS